MAGEVQFKTYINQGAVKQKFTRAVGPVLRRVLNDAGKEMVDTANKLMASDFDLNRPYERRRYPGSRRAGQALSYEITGNDERLTLGFRILGGDEVFKRVLGMNYGMGGPRRIVPNGNWSLKGASLAVRDAPTRREGRYGLARLAFPFPYENSPYKVFRSVHWKPTGRASQGTGFLEEARDLAAYNLGGRIVA